LIDLTMKTMDLQADITWIKSQLDKVTDPNLIEAFKNMLQYRNKKESADWWDEISEAERAAIDEGIAQADRGELIPYEEVRKQVKEKFGI